jgi:hypothetical protein
MCDSRENEFVVVKNETGGGLFAPRIASVGVAAIPEGCKSGPASAAQRPWSISIVGEMACDTLGWIDTRILCDSRENEFVATQNEGKIALTVVPGGCKSKQ